MKIEVPLSPWDEELSQAATPKLFSGFSPFQAGTNNVGKNLSSKLSAAKRTPLSNLANNSATFSLADCPPEPIQEPESRIQLVINIQESPKEVQSEAETLRLRVAQLEVDLAQAEAQQINAVTPVALTFQVVEGVQDGKNLVDSRVVEAMREEMESLAATKDEKIDMLHATNSQLQESLIQERTSALQHAEIAQDLRSECHALTAELNAFREQQQQQHAKSAPPVDNTAELRELHAQLNEAQLTEARLLDKIAHLESAAQERADEHAATLEFLSLERQAETEERAEAEGRLQRAVKSAAEYEALAKRYDEERGAAIANVAKAEQEVDLLAEEITVLHRQMNYARHVLGSNQAALDHAVPTVGRLSRELAAWCDKRVGGGHSTFNTSAVPGSTGPSTATRTPRTLPRSIMRR